jgi:YHS domain-containing protein
MKTILTVLLIGAASLAASSSHAQDATPSASYPLKTCVVSGEKLGGMGKPYVFTYEGTEVELCCSHCKADFNEDPAKFIKKIQDAKKGS